jgi:hypothetical protein
MADRVIFKSVSHIQRRVVVKILVIKHRTSSSTMHSYKSKRGTRL